MNILKRIFIVITAVISIAVKSNAQSEPTDTLTIIQEIEEPGKITVTAPAGINRILSPESVATEQKEEDNEAHQSSSRASVRVGYRIQVFDDNNAMTAKHEAQNRKRHIESRFPEYKVYTQFNSPYWRVKVGDFRTRSEAEAALGAIRAAFPGYSSQLRVVRDRINANH